MVLFNKTTRMARMLLLAGLLPALLSLTAGRAEASESLRRQMGGFARDIKKFLSGRGETAVSLGEFMGPPQLAANPGPGLALMLAQELEKVGVVLKSRSRLGLSGEFRDVTDEQSRQLAVELKVKVVDRSNRPLQVFSAGVLDAADIAQLTGANAYLPPGTDAERNRQLGRALENPQVFVRGSRVYSIAGRPYAVEVLIGRAARRPQLSEGLPFVGITRGEMYAIRLTNNSDKEAAVQLTVDGINVFAFNEDPEPDGRVRKDYRVLIAPRGTALVQGWYRANAKSDSFQVTSYAKSAAAQVKSSARVGTITAMFSVSGPKAPPPPRPPSAPLAFKREFKSADAAEAAADEAPTSPANSSGSSPSSSPGSATGFGAPVEERYVTRDRDIRPVSDVITVRYTKD